VRGDSLRDLYAKTLALILLGLLGGIGALVDYWPSGSELPQVQAALAPPEAGTALASAHAAVPSGPLGTEARTSEARTFRSDRTTPTIRTTPATSTTVARADRAVTTTPLDAPAAPEPTVAELVLHADPAVFDLGTAVALGSAPAAPIPALPSPAALGALPQAMTVALTRPGMLEAVAAAEAAALMADADDGGFFSDAGDAAKKAGSTILSGTIKAGAPLVGVVRFLGGALKKIRFAEGASSSYR
jgi:hypothetical protein